MLVENVVFHSANYGDTFDILALDYYNDELLCHHIINANPDFAGVLIFKGGEQIIIPIIEQSVSQTLPPWKR